MWKARLGGERRRSSTAAAPAHVNAGDGSVCEADDISLSRQARHERRAASPCTSDEDGSSSSEHVGALVDHDAAADTGHGLNSRPPTASPPDDRASSDSTRKSFLSRRNHHHHHDQHRPRAHRHPHAPNLAPTMASAFVSKSRRVRFDLVLRVHDLNNVPLVSGTSFVKWHLPSSTAAEHRGRTPKAAIKEHRVVFGYEKAMTVRLVVGKAGMLQECWIHLEVLQEYSAGGRGERITLGHIRLNLAEYVEASEAAPLLSPTTTNTTTTGNNHNNHNTGTAPTAAPAAGGVTTADSTQAGRADEGVTRRYLMQDSKINSTLKIGVSMRHAEGTRDYVAPPLRTAPVFGGIAGIIAGSEPAAMQSATGLGVSKTPDMDAAAAMTGGDGPDGLGADATGTPNLSSRNREAGEMQDMYRRTLAAYWASQPGELKADECVEDIFAGGDGWGKGGRPPSNYGSSGSAYGPPGGSGTKDADGETGREGGGSGGARMGGGGAGGGGGGGGRGMMNGHNRNASRHHHHHHRGSKLGGPGGPRHHKGAGELDEMEVREDLVGWQVSEKTFS